jgi:hypothetical protein
MSADPTLDTTQRHINRVSDILGAVQELWYRAAPELSERELQWFARCGDAQIAIENISSAMECIGCCIAADETSGVFQHAGNVSVLLDSLAESLRGIGALVFLRESATSQLRLRKVSG